MRPHPRGRAGQGDGLAEADGVRIIVSLDLPSPDLHDRGRIMRRPTPARRLFMGLFTVTAAFLSRPAVGDPPRTEKAADVVRAPDPWIAAHLDELETLYKHLHTHPELSYQENETSGRMAAELKQAGA